MRFAAFISEQLDRRRGTQSKLAKILGVSRSTITAWRNGSKPEFAMCLRLAEHFRLDPLVMFRMVGDANYEKVYRRFFTQRVKSYRLAGEASETGRTGSISEDELYPDAEHASIHRELQFVLEAGSRESKAVATMIYLAARQLEARSGERRKPAQAPAPKENPKKGAENSRPPIQKKASRKGSTPRQESKKGRRPPRAN